MKTLWIALSALVVLCAGYGAMTGLNKAHAAQALLEDKVAALEETQQLVAKDASSAKAALAQTQADLAKTRADLAQAQTELAQAGAQLAQKDRMVAQQKEAEQVVAQQQAAVEANQDVAVKTLATTLGDSQNQLVALQTKYNTLVGQFNKLRASYDDMAGQNNRLTAQVAQMQSEFAAARDRAVREATNSLRQQVAEAQQALSDSQQELANAQKAVGVLQVRAVVGDLQYMVTKKIHTPAGPVKVGTVVQNVPAGFAVVLQGVQTGTVLPPITVTESVFNSLNNGQVYNKANLQGILP